MSSPFHESLFRGIFIETASGARFLKEDELRQIVECAEFAFELWLSEQPMLFSIEAQECLKKGQVTRLWTTKPGRFDNYCGRLVDLHPLRGRLVA